MIILHIAGLSGNKSAGPTVTVTKNVEFSNKTGNNTALFNVSNNKLEGLIDKNKLFLLTDYNSISSLPAPFNKPDIVVFQSMYIKEFIPLYKEIKKMNIPYVVTPRGALTDKAQKKKRIKKKLGNILFFNKFIRQAKCINFLTNNEYNESKKFIIKDYYINGNGINNNHKTRNFNETNKNFIVSFIGRIEWYHKGLDYLIESVNIGKTEFRKSNFIFNLYGPDDFNSYKKLNKLIKKYEIDDLVKINGPIFDKEKENVLLSTDLFIHTSRLEGQPNAVIEAISYGIPVLVTPGTNIDKDVADNKLGFTSKFEISDISKMLMFAYSNRKKFIEYGKREIMYAKKFFDWDNIVKTNINEYKKIISKNLK